MDEPLTVIDPDLKFRLRRKLKEINEQYKLTLIYVTYDQSEAITFAEQIVVMDKGKIGQVGTPKDLFKKLETTFAVYFTGSPAMNLFTCEVASEDVEASPTGDLFLLTDGGEGNLIKILGSSR